MDADASVKEGFLVRLNSARQRRMDTGESVKKGYLDGKINRANRADMLHWELENAEKS